MVFSTNHPSVESLQIHTHTFNGLTVRTGDILCTQDGTPGSLFGALWRLIGLIAPGEIDHCVLYIGPGGRCIESAVRGVVTFDMAGKNWNPYPVHRQRLLLDTLLGVAYPLAGRGLSEEAEADVRRGVAAYCLDKVTHRRPYNLNYFNPQSDGAFYCSQLVYKSYLHYGIDLNVNQGVPTTGPLDRIVFPQEIWNACEHRRVPAPQTEPSDADEGQT